MSRSSKRRGDFEPGRSSPGAAPRIEPLGPHVLLISLEGYLDEDLAPAIAEALDRHLRASATPVHVCWDVERVDNYHSDVRVKITRALLANREKVASVKVLVRSKIVKMGVAVANLALGGLVRAYESRAEFTRAVARAEAGDGPQR